MVEGGAGKGEAEETQNGGKAELKEGEADETRGLEGGAERRRKLKKPEGWKGGSLREEVPKGARKR